MTTAIKAADNSTRLPVLLLVTTFIHPNQTTYHLVRIRVQADNLGRIPEAVVVEYVKPEPGEEECIMQDEYRKATVLCRTTGLDIFACGCEQPPWRLMPKLGELTFLEPIWTFWGRLF
jgi:hypothetical protein